jgi:hypothetical protein
MAEDTKSTNPKDAAATSRIDTSLFPMSAIVWGSLAMTEGDLKYGGYNYRPAGVQSSVYIAANDRHKGKWWSGEECDSRTRVPHLGSALASIAILIDSTVQGNLNDDRPPKQRVDIYDEAEEIVKHLQQLFPRRVPRYRERP